MRQSGVCDQERLKQSAQLQRLARIYNLDKAGVSVIPSRKGTRIVQFSLISTILVLNSLHAG